MYSLPQDTDLSAFVGCHLEVVSVSQFQVNLSFDGLRNVGISVEGDFAVHAPSSDAVRYPSAPDGATALIALLGAKVVDAVVSEPGTTRVEFAGGATITVYDSKSHYESYQIHMGERLIVV